MLILLIFYAEKLAGTLNTTHRQLAGSAVASAAIILWVAAYDSWVAHRIIEFYGATAVVPILLYNGEKGSYRLPKWFFYAFYPLHLCLLIAIRNFAKFIK